jgi:nucleoside diphosphate kinase
VLCKPNNIGDGLNEKIITAFEKHGFKLITMKFASGEK